MVEGKLVTPAVLAANANDYFSIPDHLSDLISQLRDLTGYDIENIIVFDFESYKDKPVGVALTNGQQSIFVPTTANVLKALGKLFLRGRNLIVAHNLKYDLSILASSIDMSPVEIRRLTTNNVFVDTLLLHHLLSPEETHKLKMLAYEYTKLGGYEGDIGGNFWKSSLWKNLAESFLLWGKANELKKIEIPLREDKEAHYILSSILKFKEVDLNIASNLDLQQLGMFSDIDDSVNARLMKLIALYSVTDAYVTLSILPSILNALLKQRDVKTLLKTVIFKLPVSLTAIEKRGIGIDIDEATQKLSDLNTMASQIMNDINSIFKQELSMLQEVSNRLSESEARKIIKSKLGRTPSKQTLLNNIYNYIKKVSDEELLEAIIRLYIYYADLSDVLDLDEINIRSPLQLQKVLKMLLILNVRSKEDLHALELLQSTSEDVLKKISSQFGEDHPLGKITSLILEYRKIFKLISTYITPYITFVDSNNRIHPEFKQHGTVTGRLCLSVNTNILLPDGTEKKLLSIEKGDIIYSPFSIDKKAIVKEVYHVFAPAIKLFYRYKALPEEIVASPHHRLLASIDGNTRWWKVVSIVDAFSSNRDVKLIGVEDGKFVEFTLYAFSPSRVQHLMDIEVDYTPTSTEYGRLAHAFVANSVISHNSSQNPNAQNMPKGSGIRELIIPPDGYKLIEADYSQVELRVAAAVAGEKYMIQAFKDGRDIHRATASLVFRKPEEEITDMERRAAKSVNFGILYGMGALSLSERIGVSEQEAEEFIKQYFATFPQFREWIASTIQFAKTHGYVDTYFGRRRYLIPDIISPDPRARKNAEREAINTPIQGTASDLTLSSIVYLSELLPDDVFIINTVHDSIIFEVPESKIEEITQLIKAVMESPPILSPGHVLTKVPIKVDIEVMDRWH